MRSLDAFPPARWFVFACSAAGQVPALTDARNRGSVRVLERAGFTRLDERQALFKEELCTEFVYACHRP